MTKRKRNRSQFEKSTNTAKDLLQFESLEDRRVLATGVLNMATSSLGIDLDVGDSRVVLSNVGNLVSLDGSTDLDPGTPGEQTVSIGEVDKIYVSGVDGQAQTFIFQGNYDDLVDLAISDVSNVVFDGFYELTGDLTIQQSVGELPGHVGDTVNNTLTVHGDTNLELPGSLLELDKGSNDLGGAFNFESELAGAQHRLTSDGAVTLDTIDVAHQLRIETPEIRDNSGSNIRIHKAYFKSDFIHIGESAADFVDFDMLNFKSEGVVNVSDDSNVELIGVSFAETLNLVATDWVSDAQFARTTVSGLATFNAEQIALGEREIDEFRAGQLSFNTITHAHFSVDGNLIISGKNTANTIDLASDDNIILTPLSSLLVTHHTGFQAVGSIAVGGLEGDRFVTNTISFIAPNGHTELNVDGDVHILDVKNIANSLSLTAEGNITDDINAKTKVNTHTDLRAGNSIHVGEGEAGAFETATVTFGAGNQVIMEQIEFLMLLGDNTADGLLMFSDSGIGNAPNATIDIGGHAQFFAESVDIGNAANDSFNAGWISFGAEDTVSISENSDLILVGNNTATDLNLEVDGMLFDAPDTASNILGHAHLMADTIIIGSQSQFQADSLQFTSIGNTTIHEHGDMFLAGSTSANSIRLVSSGTIGNEANASVVSNNSLDLQAVTVLLGAQTGDQFLTTTLTFQTTTDTRIQFDGDVLLFGDSSARSFELVAAGNIQDVDDATVHAALFGRLEGDVIVLGDSDLDCFTIDTSNVQVVATGFQMVNIDQCG